MKLKEIINMKKLTIFLSITALLLGTVITATGAVTYDFDSLSPGTYTEATFNSYFDGILFDNTGGHSLKVVSTSFPAPLHVLQANFSGNVIINDPYWNSDGSRNSTIATFEALTDYVSITLGDGGVDQDNLFLNAYDSSNNLIDGVSFLNPDTSYAGHTLSINSATADIAWVEFYGVDSSGLNSVFWDNFSFNKGTTSVPIPSTLLLFGLGLLGLAGGSRKK